MELYVLQNTPWETAPFYFSSGLKWQTLSSMCVASDPQQVSPNRTSPSVTGIGLLSLQVSVPPPYQI
jgi:hypothetical protein